MTIIRKHVVWHSNGRRVASASHGQPRRAPNYWTITAAGDSGKWYPMLGDEKTILKMYPPDDDLVTRTKIVKLLGSTRIQAIKETRHIASWN